MATLLALILPAVQRVREAANRLTCASQLRQLALACQLYERDFKRLPPGQIGPGPNPQPGEPFFGWGPTSTGWSWLARVLPYIEQGDLVKSGGIPKKTLLASGIAATKIPFFLCPSDNPGGPLNDRGNLTGFPVGLTSYKAVSGSNWGYDETQNLNFTTPDRHQGTNGSYDGLNRGDGAMFRVDYRDPRRMVDIQDGLSHTFLIGEDQPLLNAWCSGPYTTHAYGTCAIPLNTRTHETERRSHRSIGIARTASAVPISSAASSPWPIVRSTSFVRTST